MLFVHRQNGPTAVGRSVAVSETPPMPPSPPPPRYATPIGLGATSNVPAAFMFCRLVYFHSKFPYVSEFVKQMTDMLS